MEEFGKLEERVVLVGVQTDDHDNVEESLDELKELASTAGAVTVGRIIQNRESVHPGTYIGKGKIEEVRALVYAMDATGIICDDELSPAQLNNLERELDCKVMDRTLLILDIFAARAITSEGKIQVELAQLRYRSARLVGLRESLSRLGGGIGTRGPGEKKLETDRRLIRTRISALKQELSQVEKHRELIRSSRARGNMKTAAIVGYTNAGKSTLLRQLTGYLQPDSGECRLFNMPLNEWSITELVKHRAVMRQNSHMAFPFSVQEVIQMGRHPHRTGNQDNETAQIMALCDCQALANRDYRQLSGGEQQRVQLARLLVQLWEPTPSPKWLLLDEPTSALDIHHQQHLFRLLRQLVHERQFNVCCVLHDLNLAARYADRVVLMQKGKVIANGKPQDVLTQQALTMLYGADITVLKDPANHSPLIVLDH